jgi:alpha-ketoglutaric semialdehyde dehydrogenase
MLMERNVWPDTIPHSIGNATGQADRTFDKLRPHDGTLMCQVASGNESDVRAAVASARAAFDAWSRLTVVRRGEILHAVTDELRRRREEIAAVVAAETGKSLNMALGETDGAIALGYFYAGEGRRFYARTTTSATPNRTAATVREPLGVAALIIAANTPIANVAWKVFPALICGNCAVLKAAEDTPVTAWLFAECARAAGLPDGVLNIIHGFGEEAGAPLVAHPDIAVISFTGSTAVGKRIAVTAGERLTRVSLELGGKNPFVVCDDADLELAAHWASLSAFSNAGQRCAAGSRIIVFDAVYDRFRDMLVERTRKLKVGPSNEDDLGPVINQRQLSNMLNAVTAVTQRGGRVLIGGTRMDGEAHRNGFYMAPTLVENVEPGDDFSCSELFGPIASLYRATDFNHALRIANESPYGLTACIHTRNLNRASEFVARVHAGVAVVNAGTFGSEPHMPFGGVKQSGNGSREPGTEALDIYSNLKAVYVSFDPGQV